MVSEVNQREDRTMRPGPVRGRRETLTAPSLWSLQQEECQAETTRQKTWSGTKVWEVEKVSSR